MPRKIKTIVKLTIQASMATPAPPVGTALGPHGIKIMDFCSEFNEKTQNLKGSLIPALITIYDDRSFSFIIKKSPVSNMIKKIISLEKGSGTTGREFVGQITQAQIDQIARDKMEDLNTPDLEAAKRMVIGTARSMGVKIVD
jgi:large subunit ribosomal protein L11